MEASAAQKRPVNQTCSQCGAVQAAHNLTCCFCDSPLSGDFSTQQDRQLYTSRTFTNGAHAIEVCADPVPPCAGVTAATEQDVEWRRDLSQRIAAHRARRRKIESHPDQARFVFEGASKPEQAHRVALNEGTGPAQDDFAFTLAIGRQKAAQKPQPARMEIDVSIPLPAAPADLQSKNKQRPTEASSSYSVAPLEERRLAGFIDLTCLAFAYGGFLVLFSSLGGEFTPNRLSAAVYTSTIAIVYLQYFALFTIFGGTTPGMMFRGLQVRSFDGDLPSPRQMVWRSVGYVLSACTLFLGFLWACWDEDTFTWHDRLSRTYLTVAEAFANEVTESGA